MTLSENPSLDDLVEYQPQVDVARPWADDEGSRFTTAEVAAT